MGRGRSTCKHKLYRDNSQPMFGFVEGWSKQKWPESKFITKEYIINLSPLGLFNFNFYKLVWRTAYVEFTTILAMLLPFFNDFLGLLGAASFWPLTVYFPISFRSAGSVQGLIHSVQKYCEEEKKKKKGEKNKNVALTGMSCGVHLS
ncbi:amino acid permease 6-like [Capsicum annuum]